MRIILKNLICHRRKNIIMILTVVFSTVLLNAYIWNIESNYMQLKELAGVTPVFCYITNMTGSKSAGLEISRKNIKQLSESEYVKNLAYAIKVNGCVGHIPEDEWYKLSYNVMAVNSVDAVLDFTYDDIEMDGDKEAFFDSDENIVLLSKDIMDKNGLKIGDEVPITLYYYQYDGLDIYSNPLDYPTVKIAGQMKQSALSAEGFNLDILLPVRYIEKIFDEKGIHLFMDSASFYIKDPLKLNEAKDAFKQMYLLSRSPNALESYMGIALNIKDATFISLAGNLLRNISLLKLFAIPLCLLIFALDFLLSFILVRNRTNEYITMRLLGVYEYQCNIFYGVEGFILAGLAAFTGNLITVFTQKENINFLYSLLIIAACLSGTFAALIFTGMELKGKNTWK